MVRGMDYFSEIAPLEGPGVTDQDIADARNLDASKVKDIPAGELASYLHETGLMFTAGMSGESGGVLKVLYDLPSTPPNLKAGMDWLRSHLSLGNPGPVRTTRPDIAALMDGVLALLATPGVLDQVAVTIEDITAQMDAWTGGRKYQNVTAQQVANTRAEHQRVENYLAITTEWQTAYQAHAEGPSNTGDRTAFIAGLQAAVDAMGA